MNRDARRIELDFDLPTQLFHRVPPLEVASANIVLMAFESIFAGQALELETRQAGNDRERRERAPVRSLGLACRNNLWRRGDMTRSRWMPPGRDYLDSSNLDKNQSGCSFDHRPEHNCFGRPISANNKLTGP